MPPSIRTSSIRSPNFGGLRAYPAALIVFLGVLWLAGGASRPDAWGQLVVRTTSAAILAWVALTGKRLTWSSMGPIGILLGCAIALPAIQLIPLPPVWWQDLPGRALLSRAANINTLPQPWRPLSIVPGATINALASLLVPYATFVLMWQSEPADRRWLTVAILGLTVASMAVGLLQFVGGGFNNPFINDSVGQVSGSFANRNHLALFLAIGCLLCLAWAFPAVKRASWRAPLALGLTLTFVLTILATGSRAGLLLGLLAIVIGLFLARDGIRRELQHRPRWVFPVVVAGVTVIAVGSVLLAITADRAIAINRAFSVDMGQDMRSRGFPTVLAMISAYFPIGTGAGSFDPIFRIHEPFSLLKPTYFNHAHNDWLEVILDTGIAGGMLLLAAVIWWGRVSVLVWSGVVSERKHLARTGSGILFLVMIASIFDYPARTPMMMALLIVAAVWLSEGRHER